MSWKSSFKTYQSGKLFFLLFKLFQYCHLCFYHLGLMEDTAVGEGFCDLNGICNGRCFAAFEFVPFFFNPSLL